MNTSAIVACCFAIFALAGCGSMGKGSVDRAKVESYMASGNCDAAIRETDSINLPGWRAVFVGMIYHDCKRDKPTAIRYWTLAARYGVPNAQEILVKMGQPVPTADLARNDSDADALNLLNAAIMGWNAGRTRNSNPSITCRSTRFDKDTSMTTCD